MRVALDTSTLTLSLAVLDGDRLVKHVTVGPPTRVSQALPQAIIDAVPLSSITSFVVGIGPGSFTGLRISLACVKGLAYALKVPVAGVSSLAAVAAEGFATANVGDPTTVPSGRPDEQRSPTRKEGPFGQHDLFAAAVVKKGELYLRRDGTEQVVTVQGFADAMRERPGAIALGPGIVEYKAQLVDLGIEPGRLLETVKFPSAVHLARLAGPAAAFDPKALFALEPHYIRSSGAEDNPKFPPLAGVPAQARMRE